MKANEKTAEKFASIMLKKMDEMKDQNWQIPWFCEGERRNFYPQNISGRKYESGNALLLLFCCMWGNYKTPIFLTFNQCKKLEIAVKKGSESFPVYYKNFIVTHKETKERIDFDDFILLSKEEQKSYNLRGYIKYYNVFNIEQTNYAEKYPDKWTKFLEHFSNKEDSTKIKDICSCSSLDRMIDNDSWICSIILKKQNRAFYSINSDLIVCPLKSQFSNQHNFYGTLLHEMTHSTGTAERLNRTFGKFFGDSSYAREEVVAELTAAFSGFQLGIFSEPNKDSALYLNSWISNLKESPEFIFSVLDDVVKASNYLMESLNDEVEQPTKLVI